MRKLLRFLIPTVAALDLMAFGLSAASYAAKDRTAHPMFGAALVSPIHTTATDGEPWRI